MSQRDPKRKPQRAYQFRDLKPAGVPYSRKHVTTLEKRDEFPMHFQLGPNSIAWVADEVDAWVENKIRGRNVERPPGRRAAHGADEHRATR